MTPKSQATRLLAHVLSQGFIRPRDLDELNIPRSVLQRLVEAGQLVRRARGVYAAVDHPSTRHTELAEVCTRTPRATICLFSALDYHELTAQIPRAVWIMIDRRSRRPMIKQPETHIVYASGSALTAGVGKHQIEGVEVNITNAAKTVTDCFKYRRHVGQDVAIEALRDCLDQGQATPGEIFALAKVDRVANLMRPYLEALV